MRQNKNHNRDRGGLLLDSGGQALDRSSFLCISSKVRPLVSG